jgi:hypothetical protein
MQILEIRKLRQNSKRLLRLMRYCPIRIREQSMTSLVMPLLMVAQVADSTLTKPTSAISLATSLEVASAALVTSLVVDALRIQMLQERVQMYVHPFVSPSRKLYLVVRRNWNYI